MSHNQRSVLKQLLKYYADDKRKKRSKCKGGRIHLNERPGIRSVCMLAILDDTATFTTRIGLDSLMPPSYFSMVACHRIDPLNHSIYPGQGLNLDR